MKKIAAAICLILICSGFLEAKVKLGIDVLREMDYAPLKGKRVGLITNQTGRDSRGKSTIDLLFHAKGVKLTALFSPEHGIRGDAKHGEKITDGRDPKTKLPVYSLYGKTERLTEEMLDDVDVLVFDIQDVGTRFYTYTTTLAYALEEAAKFKVQFMVLDRPNPITGALFEGELLSPDIKKHFTAYLELPVRHGMTVGEIADWYNKSSDIRADLSVIKMKGWRRVMWWDETGLKFYAPSPNIKNLRAALLYPGIGCFEATNVSVGRGTMRPFEVFGAPWIDGEKLAEQLNFLRLAGFEFKAAEFTPKDDLYKGEKCGGVKIIITDRNRARPFELFIQAASALREFYPDKFQMRWDEIERVTGSGTFRWMLEHGYSPESIILPVQDRAAKFQEFIKPFLIYD